jgi:hypothetical protein
MLEFVFPNKYFKKRSCEYDRIGALSAGSDVIPDVTTSGTTSGT